MFGVADIMHSKTYLTAMVAEQSTMLLAFPKHVITAQLQHHEILQKYVRDCDFFFNLPLIKVLEISPACSCIFALKPLIISCLRCIPLQLQTTTPTCH